MTNDWMRKRKDEEGLDKKEKRRNEEELNNE